MVKSSELIKDINETRGKAFWWLGQLGYAVKLAGLNIYIDMYISERENPRREVPPAFKPSEVTNADYFFGTHDHSDHIDRRAWHELSVSSPSAKFVVPLPHVDKLARELSIDKARFIGVEDGVTVTSGALRITGVAAAHEFLECDETGAHKFLGYVIEADGVTLYHSGDCCIYEGLLAKLRAIGKIDVMFLPINGRDGTRYRTKCIGNMTYQEAVDLAGAVKPGLVVPGHYDMFKHNSEDPAKFADYIEAKYPGVKYWIGEHGTRVEI